MGVDTSIYGNIRPFTMGDPMGEAGKIMGLQQAQRKFMMEDAISQAGASSGGDPAKMAQILMSKGQYEPAIKLQGQAASIDKEKRLGAAADTDRKLKIAEAAASDAIALDHVWRQSLEQAGGNRQAAMMAVQPFYQQMGSKWAQLGMQMPEQFDPDANFASIGQAKEAIQYMKTLTPEKPSVVREYEYAKGQGYKGTFQQYQLEQNKAKGTNVTLNAGTEKKYGEALAGKIAEADVSMRDVAIKAPELAERSNSVIKLINSGVITGTGAEARLAIGKALNLAGDSDSETIANTEALVTELAGTTLDAIKGSGLGSGQGFTDKDRQFLQDAKAGRIPLESSTIRRIATLNHRAAVKSAERWNKRVKEIPESALAGTGLTRDQIQVPDLDTSKPQETPKAANPREVEHQGKMYKFPTPAAAKRFKEDMGL
jgi:hypothetical protein